MSPGKKLFGIVIVLILLSQYAVKAQQTNQAITSEEIKIGLDRIFGLDQRLVSGSSYPGSATGSISGHPYWIDSNWKDGSVLIDGVQYENLLLKYDISSNSLVLNTINLNSQAIQLSLNKNSVSEFTLDNRKFIRFQGKDHFSKHDFCEECVTGTLNYLQIRNKVLSVATGGSTDFKYKIYIADFLLLDNELIRFNSKRVLYKLFPEHKKEIKHFIFHNSLSPGRKNTDDRIRLIEYCNSLLSISE